MTSDGRSETCGQYRRMKGEYVHRFMVDWPLDGRQVRTCLFGFGEPQTLPAALSSGAVCFSRRHNSDHQVKRSTGPWLMHLSAHVVLRILATSPALRDRASTLGTD
jgi:hypothetical protein